MKSTGKSTVSIGIKTPGLILVNGIAYGNRDEYFQQSYGNLCLDIVYPDNHFFPLPQFKKERLPLVVFCIGGAFFTMERSLRMPLMMEIAKRGYVCASVDYSLTHDTARKPPFPKMIQDVKQAIRFLRAHADRFFIDPEHVAVMGDSAGGYITSIVASTNGDPEYTAGEYLDYSDEVQAAVCLYPLIDYVVLKEKPGEDTPMIYPTDPVANPEYNQKVSALHLAHKGMPPFLIMHGTADHLMPYKQSELLYDALQKAGVDAKLLLIEGATHAGAQFYQEETADIIAGFLEEAFEV